MLLQHLRDFEWLNEPEGVFFIDDGMKVVSSPSTAFEQTRYESSETKDSGHLFFKNIKGDFSLTLSWQTTNQKLFSECGIMVRLDEKNWAKTSLFLSEDINSYICSVVNNLGLSDISQLEVGFHNKVYYRLESKSGFFSFLYSIDGEKYHKIREFSFINKALEFGVGAYILSGGAEEFEAVLTGIELKV